MVKVNSIQVVSTKSKEDDIRHPSFHEAVGPVLTYGQFFGLLPADGVLSNDEEKVKFRWKSVKTIYSMIFLFCGTVESGLGTRRLLRLGFNINFAEGLLFFILAMFRAFVFFNLARKWNVIMRLWKKCESPFLQPPYKVNGWSLKTKIKVIFIPLAILTLSKFNLNLKMIHH
jgi:gustatory receptor